MATNRIKKYFIFILLCSLAACCKPKPKESMIMTMHPQETRNWCWAASGQMVMDYLGNNVSQCAQANDRFGRSDCCNITLCPNPTQNHPCVNGGWPEFDKYGFKFTRTSDTAITWKQLTTELSCQNRPVAFAWHWPGGGGHMMVAKGYKTEDGINFVEVFDPWSPCIGDQSFITYDYYVESIGHHTHWDDFYKISR